MLVSLTDAKDRLTDLVKRAEAGEYVVLTRHGQAVVRLVPVKRMPTMEEKRALLDETWAAAVAARLERDDDGEPSAARSQDFLYDEYGLPT